MSNEPLPARWCRLTFRNQSARRGGLKEGWKREHRVGGPIPVASPQDSVLSIKEKRKREREREGGGREYGEEEEERNAPLAHGISHPPPYARAVIVYGEAPRSPRKVISLKNVISVRRDGVEEKKNR